MRPRGRCRSPPRGGGLYLGLRVDPPAQACWFGLPQVRSFSIHAVSLWPSFSSLTKDIHGEGASARLEKQRPWSTLRAPVRLAAERRGPGGRRTLQAVSATKRRNTASALPGTVLSAIAHRTAPGVSESPAAPPRQGVNPCIGSAGTDMPTVRCRILRSTQGIRMPLRQR